MRALLGLIWNLFVWGGCAYLVFWKGCSGWWFLLALAISDNLKE